MKQCILVVLVISLITSIPLPISCVVQREKKHANVVKDSLSFATTTLLLLVAYFCFHEAYCSFGLLLSPSQNLTNETQGSWISKITAQTAGLFVSSLKKPVNSTSYAHEISGSISEWIMFFSNFSAVIGWTTLGLMATKLSLLKISREIKPLKKYKEG